MILAGHEESKLKRVSEFAMKGGERQLYLGDSDSNYSVHGVDLVVWVNISTAFSAIRESKH